MGGVSGGGSEKLARLVAQMEAMAKGKGLRSKLMKNLSVEALNQVQECFIFQRDPYGNAWKRSRLTGKRAGGLTLRDTNRLMNSFRANATAQNFHVTNNTVYAAVHQYGGTIEHPARQAIRGKGGREIAAGRKIGARRRVTVTEVKSGQSIMPRRAFLPDPGNTGHIWRAALTSVAILVLEHHFQRKGG